MTDRILKYPLSGVGTTVIEWPSQSTVVACAMQHGVPTIWARVDDDNDSERRKFVVLPTGIEIPRDVDDDEAAWEGTIFDGQFVWHVFNLGETDDEVTLPANGPVLQS